MGDAPSVFLCKPGHWGRLNVASAVYATKRNYSGQLQTPHAYFLPSSLKKDGFHLVSNFVNFKLTYRASFGASDAMSSQYSHRIPILATLLKVGLNYKSCH
jgi:hypothetical protein